MFSDIKINFCHEATDGERRYSPTLSLISALDDNGCNVTHRSLYPMQKPGIPGLGGWVDTETSLDG
jgi:hypothetical protein